MRLFNGRLTAIWTNVIPQVPYNTNSWSLRLHRIFPESLSYFSSKNLTKMGEKFRQKYYVWLRNVAVFFVVSKSIFLFLYVPKWKVFVVKECRMERVEDIFSVWKRIPPYTTWAESTWKICKGTSNGMNFIQIPQI